MNWNCQHPSSQKNTQNSKIKRSSGMDGVDAAIPINYRRESVGVEAVHSECVVVSKDVSENNSLYLLASHSVSRDSVEFFGSPPKIVEKRF